MIRIGLDIGSTTLKCVILNASGELLYKDYRRHFSRIAENAAAMLGEIAAAFPNERECSASSCPARRAWASRRRLACPSCRRYIATRDGGCGITCPTRDVVDRAGRRGREDHVSSTGEALEERMNGSCAGGTGAFIDQMATLLNVTPTSWTTSAQRAEQHLHHRLALRRVCQERTSSRCINQGARKEDICREHLSGAVVNQTDRGPGAGTADRGQSRCILGGPLYLLQSLRQRFDETLQLRKGVVFPENVAVFRGAGRGLLSDEPGVVRPRRAAQRAGTATAAAAHYRACPPLFSSQEEYDALCRAARARRRRARDTPAPDGPVEAYLGIDCRLAPRSRLVLMDLNGEHPLHALPAPTRANPVADRAGSAARYLRALRRPREHRSAAAATGYGEDLIRNAFHRRRGRGGNDRPLHGGQALRPAGGLHHRHRRAGHQMLQDPQRRDRQHLSQRGLLLGLRLVSCRPLPGALGYDVAEFAALGLFAERAGRPRLAAARCL